MKKLLAAFLLIVSTTVWSATYYIDYEQGQDTNNGLSKTAAWKHCPGMPTATGQAGAHLGQAGDIFVFKGGVIWQYSATDSMFPLEVTYTTGWANGSKTHPITFTRDSSWYSGLAFTRPVFDGNGIARRLFSLAYSPWFVVDGFDLRHHGGNGYMDGGISLYLSAHSIIRNCYVHDWRRTGTTDGKYGGITTQTSDSILIDNCEIHGDSAGNCGIAIYENGGADPEVRNCIIHNVPNGFLGGGKIHHCRIYDINDSFDPQEHENGIETFSGGSAIHDNIIHDVKVGVTLLVCGDDIYNNVIYSNGPIAIQIDTNCGNDATAVARVYNNTLEGGTVVRIVPRGTTLGTLILRNNLYISDNASGACYNSLPDCSNVISVTDDHNIPLTYAAAAAQGLTAANQFRPTAAGNSTVDAGIDLSGVFTTDIRGIARPQGAGWDVGAYEFTANGIADFGLRTADRPTQPLLPNPVGARLLGQYVQANGSLLVRDLAGKAMGTKTLCQPGIYIVQKRDTHSTQKVIVVK